MVDTSAGTARWRLERLGSSAPSDDILPQLRLTNELRTLLLPFIESTGSRGDSPLP
jgi:hypothetical protein